MELPFSQACERNKDPILAELQKHFAGVATVLEIGSGTWQHAVHFAARLPHVTWQTSDLPVNHAGIQAWLDHAGGDNLVAPLALDVTKTWPSQTFDGAYSANTLHIMSWPAGQAMLRGLAEVIRPGGCLVYYGPFHMNGKPTSHSNASFDLMLRGRDPDSGIRHLEEVTAAAEQWGWALRENTAMPANNRLLVFRYEP